MSSNVLEVIYYIPDKIISQKDFSIESTFKKILLFFTEELYPKNGSKIILKKNYYYKQYKINETTKMKDLLDFNDFPENTKPRIYIKLNDLMSKDNDGNFTFILRPKINPFGFIIYSVKTNMIYEESLQKNIIKSFNLDKYNPDNSAYCNSYDTLYISGGTKPNREAVKDFWVVNYTYSIRSKKFNFKITNIKMPYEKKQHSMIYDKKENVIYIIGGNDKICIKYDIAQKIFSQLPDTNTIYIKPALFIKNDFLYIFDSFDKKKLFFEKLDLNMVKNINISKKKILWEKFYPKNYDKYVSQFYGICDMDLDDKIIFLGGERVDNNIIFYEIKNNKFENGEGKNSYAKLNDKTFYKINKNFYIAIPEFRVKENWLIAIDNITKDVSKIYFDEEGKTIFNFDSIEECDISKEPIKKENTILKSKNKMIKANSGIFVDEFEEKEEKEEKEENDLLKANINLSEIKNKSEINDINSNSDIKKLETVEINFQQELKEDKDSDKMYILREPFDPKKIKKNIKEEEKNNNNNNVNTNMIKVNKKLNLKLSQIPPNKNQKPSKNTYNKNTNVNNMNNIYVKNKYLNYEGDDWLNKKFDNHKYYEMTPNYKKNKVNLNKTPGVKNPLLKSRKIEKKNIEGQEYSFICEKIIDKDNLKYYNSYMQQSYDFEDIYGNHRFYLSRYSSEEKGFKNSLLDSESNLNENRYNSNTERIRKIDNFMDKPIPNPQSPIPKEGKK